MSGRHLYSARTKRPFDASVSSRVVSLARSMRDQPDRALAWRRSRSFVQPVAVGYPAYDCQSASTRIHSTHAHSADANVVKPSRQQSTAVAMLGQCLIVVPPSRRSSSDYQHSVTLRQDGPVMIAALCHRSGSTRTASAPRRDRAPGRGAGVRFRSDVTAIRRSG